MAGNDARHLVWELGKDRVTEDDIVSLPVHHCYVRATVGTERMPAYSMTMRKPEPGDPEMAERIRAASVAYTVSAQQADYADAAGHGKVEEYRRGVEDLKDGEGSPSQQKDESLSSTKRWKQPAKRKAQNKERKNETGRL